MNYVDLQPVESGELDTDHPLEGLTTRQSQFARKAFNGASYADAYRDTYDCSGLSQDQIRHNAGELSRHPLVSAKLRALRLEADKAATLAPGVTKAFVLNGLMNLALNAEKESVQLGAYVWLGKTAGIDLFRETTRIERVERTPEQIDAELRQRLAELGRTIEGEAQHVEPEARPARRRTRNTPT